MNVPTQPNMNMFSGFMQHMANQMRVQIGSIDDDQVLVREFQEAQGRNARQILESLDMKNGYPAQQWKDYYLDHKPRLDRLIHPPAAKATVIEASAGSSSPKTASAIPAHLSKKAPIAHAEESISSGNTKGKAPVNNKPPPLPKGYAYTRVKEEVQLPQAPSRSPTPPTVIIAGPRGNKFTAEDKEFFTNFILWQLKCDPSLTRAELCNNLENRCPHHTAQSWNSYWRHHGEIADKALDATRGDVSGSTISSSSSSSSSSDDDEDDIPMRKTTSSSTRARTTSNSIRATAIFHNSAPPRARQRENSKVNQDEMGPGGGAITVEDKREIARYIASHTELEWANKRQRFHPFHEKWPQRSAAAWTETYRRFPEEIDTNIAIFRSQTDDLKSIWSPRRNGPVPRIKQEE